MQYLSDAWLILTGKTRLRNQVPSDIDVFNARKRHTSTAVQKSLTLTAGISNFLDFFAKIRVA